MQFALPSEIVEDIDRTYQWAVNLRNPSVAYVAESECASLGAIVELVDSVPEHLITLQGKDRFDYVRSLAAIRDAVHSYRNMSLPDRMMVPSPPTLLDFNGESPIYTLRHALAKCPDSVPLPMTSELSFFAEPTLRAALRSDLSDIEQSLVNREWKAATILGGALLESLLFHAIKCMPAELAALQNKPPDAFEEWKLQAYIHVARELGLIEQQTMRLAGLARAARNLVHPGEVVTSRRTCDKASSHTVMGAVEAVVRDVGEFCHKNNRKL